MGKKKLYKRIMKNPKLNGSKLYKGNEENLTKAQSSVNYLQGAYKMMLRQIKNSEKNRKDLRKQIKKLKAKRDKMRFGFKIPVLGLRIPMVLSFLHKKILQTGITENGRDFIQIEKDIRHAEKSLEKINKRATKNWDRMSKITEAMEQADLVLQKEEMEMIKKYMVSAEQENEETSLQEGTEVEQEEQIRAEQPIAEQAQEEPEKNELDLRYESMMKSLDDINKEIAEAERNARYNKDGQQRLNELLLEKDKITAELNTVIQKQKERASKIELVSSQNEKRQKFKKDMKDPIANLYLKHHINRDNLVAVLGKEEANEFAYSLGVSYIKDILGYKGEGFGKSEVEFYIEKGLSLIDKINRGENIPKISNIIERLSNGEKIEDIPGEIRTKNTAKELYKLLSEHPEIANSENKVINKEEELEVVS